MTTPAYEDNARCECEANEYWATAVEKDPAGAVVTLNAMGTCPTPEYEVYFEALPGNVDPPEFALRCTPPTGIVIEVITPFEATVTFDIAELVRSVTVHDAQGMHTVPVKTV